MQKIALKGKEFLIRNFCENDCGKPERFLTYINTLIDDKEAMITLKTRKTIDEEEKWIGEAFSLVKASKMAMIIAECDDLIIGETAVRLCDGRKDHVAELGISILKDYREYGLGSVLLNRIVGAAAKELSPPPKMIRLSVFSTNDKAIYFYRKYGFEIIAQIPEQIEFTGQFFDEVIMIRNV